MKSLLLLSLLTLLATPALARIGETREQCEARYGKALMSKEDTTAHAKAGFELFCTYHEGKCVRITFTHEQDKRRISTPLSETEIQALLKSNSGGKTWTKTNDKMSVWEAENLEAIYSGDEATSPMLMITLTSFRLHQEAQDTTRKKAEEENKLKGF